MALRGSFVVILLVACTGNPLRAAETHPWVGKTVILKKSHVTLRRTPDRRSEELGVLNDHVFVVVKQEGDWVAVKSEGHLGWLESSEAVLMENALEHFTRRIEKDPEDFVAFVKRACAWEAKNDLAHAIDDVTEAIRLRPQSHICYYDRAYYHGKNKDYDRAVADYSQALRLRPDFVLAYLNRGITHEQQGKYDLAIQDLTQAIRLDPSYAAYVNRGVAYEATGDYKSALADFSAAIRLDANNAVAYRYRGRTYSDLKDHDRALADYNEAIRIDTRNVDSLNGSAWLLATSANDKLRNPKEALVRARKACALDGWQSPHFLGTLAAAYAANGEFDEAEHWQEKALQDETYATQFGATARRRLELYRQRKVARAE